MTWIMCTSGAAVAKAGANANSTITVSGARLSEWSAQAESTVNAITRKNYSDTYAALNADVTGILNDVTTSLIANNIISYDMSGYTSRAEAETMLDVNRDTATRGLSLLRDKKQTTFIDGA